MSEELEQHNGTSSSVEEHSEASKDSYPTAPMRDNKPIKAEAGNSAMENSTGAKLEDRISTDDPNLIKTENSSSSDVQKQNVLRRSSVHPDFLNIAQFMDSFGWMLRLPSLSLDTLEDGLDYTSKEPDLYFDACCNAVERLVISLLHRCGLITNPEKLITTLHKFLEYRDASLRDIIATHTSFKEIANGTKLAVILSICLSQFDENSKFKTEFNSQYSPDSLRFDPIGRDMNGNQYWLVSDDEKSHRLYVWRPPYETAGWTLLSTNSTELARVLEQLRPNESETSIRASKIGEVYLAQISPPPPTPREENTKKRQRKPREPVEVDDSIEHRVRRADIGERKSLRIVDRKVYKYEGEEEESIEETEEETEEQKEKDSEYKRAIDLAKSRKRSKKFLSIARGTTGKMSSDGGNSTDSSCGAKSNGAGDVAARTKALSKPMLEQYIRKPQFHAACRITRAFLDILVTLPSIKKIEKPAEAEDRCWACQGTEDLDTMLFCDGCDLATYHMACLHPPIDEVPEEDWYCPICEQLLLYLHLQSKFRKLNAHLMIRAATPKGGKVQRRHHAKIQQVSSAPRRQQTCRPQVSSRPFSTPQSMPGRTLPQAAYTTSRLQRGLHSTTSLVTPRTPTHLHSSPIIGTPVLPRRPRPKISEIGRLTERAMKVYEHSADDENLHGGSRKRADESSEGEEEGDAIVVRPEDIVSSDSSEEEFSYRPRATTTTGHTAAPRGYYVNGSTSTVDAPRYYTIPQNRRYTGDDFLADQAKPATDHRPTSSSRHTPNSRMGYNPLGTLYGGRGTRVYSRPQVARGSAHNPQYRRVPKSSGAGGQPHPYNHRTQGAAVSIPRPPNSDQHDQQSSRDGSGNVAVETKGLSEAQKKALAAWEEEERERERFP